MNLSRFVQELDRLYADLMACNGDAQWRFYVEREFAGRDATGCADALNRMLREAGQRAISVNRSRGAMRNDAEANRLRAERGNDQVHRLKSKTERRVLGCHVGPKQGRGGRNAESAQRFTTRDHRTHVGSSGRRRSCA